MTATPLSQAAIQTASAYTIPKIQADKSQAPVHAVPFVQKTVQATITDTVMISSQAKQLSTGSKWQSNE